MDQMEREVGLAIKDRRALLGQLVMKEPKDSRDSLDHLDLLAPPAFPSKHQLFTAARKLSTI